MSARRWAAKRDKNETPIVTALQAAGCTVTRLSDAGLPDLLVGITDRHGNRHNLLLEVKNKGGSFTPEQVEWFNTWRGQSDVVMTADHAIATVERYIGHSLGEHDE